MTLLNDNSFFKPTALYKEFMILDLIEKKKDITQREISVQIGVAVSMINAYVDEYEQKGFIKRKYFSTKTVEYFVTKKGIERRKLLNIEYLKASQSLYSSAKENIEQFLKQVEEKGFKYILLYGAGEVAEILLQSLVINKNIPITILAVIDDDMSKLGNTLVGSKIVSLIEIPEIKHDGILISSYTNRATILNKLISVNYEQKRIINFFEI